VDAAFLVRMANAQWRVGNTAAARLTLARALEKDPSNLAAQALQQRLQ
jgi:Tfp pilus assembly protein PilF